MWPRRRRTTGIAACGFVALLAAAGLDQDVAHPPRRPAVPQSRVEDVVDILHGAVVPDPYRWLERQDDAETRAWIDAQNAYAEAVVPRAGLRSAIEERLRLLMNRPEIGEPQRAGPFEYFLLRRIDEDVPVLRRRPVDPKAAAKGSVPRPIDPEFTYEAVIDPHGLSHDHTVRVELQALEPNGHRLVYSLRHGGQDETEVRIRDLRTGRDLPERLPVALYGSFDLLPDGTGFCYVRRSRQTGPRVLVHRFGTPIADDRVVFGEGVGPEHFITMLSGPTADSRLYVVQKGWTSADVLLQVGAHTAPVRPIVTGTDARYYPQIVGSEIWMRTNLEAPNSRLVAVNPRRPSREYWRTVIPEGPDVMDDFRVIEDRVYVTYLHDVSTVIRSYTKRGRPIGSVPVPAFHTASVKGAGKRRLLLTHESYLTPRSTSLVETDGGGVKPFQATAIPWNTAEITVEQVWFTSRDGTRVPMFLVHRRDTPRDGHQPVLLYGYGGFYAASKPSFNEMAALWVQAGGIYAVANIRGGSEFGENWHRSGMLLSKQNVFDDFIAAAEWLIAEGYTSSQRLAIWGVSNGGLLVGAALTQRPDLFRAVLCRFPDVDILRFYEYSTVNNIPAIPEYGDARIKEQHDAILKYSPYQNVRPRTAYPAIMVVSGDRDTRVPPLAARKFTARLQAATISNHPVVLHYRAQAGHASGNGLPFTLRVEDTAMELAFLMSELGLSLDPSTGRQPPRY